MSMLFIFSRNQSPRSTGKRNWRGNGTAAVQVEAKKNESILILIFIQISNNLKSPKNNKYRK